MVGYEKDWQSAQEALSEIWFWKSDPAIGKFQVPWVDSDLLNFSNLSPIVPFSLFFKTCKHMKKQSGFDLNIVYYLLKLSLNMFELWNDLGELISCLSFYNI